MATNMPPTQANITILQFKVFWFYTIVRECTSKYIVKIDGGNLMEKREYPNYEN